MSYVLMILNPFKKNNMNIFTVYFKQVTLALLFSLLVFTGNAQSSLLDSSESRFMRDIGLASSVAFGSSFLFDQPISDFITKKKNPFLNNFTSYAYYGGSKKLFVPVNTLLLGSAYLLKNKPLKTASWNSVKSIGSTALITGLLKLSFGRARPYEERGAYHFDPISWRDRAFRSLPSGHASLAFAFITPYAEEYSRWLYAIPLSVAFSRVYQNDHWASDVILGSFIGFSTGYFFQHKNCHISVSLNRIVIRF